MVAKKKPAMVKNGRQVKSGGKKPAVKTKGTMKPSGGGC